MLFEHLNLSKAIQRGLFEKGFTEATPIQEQVIPEVLRRNDLIGQAPTGTGKTGAYAIPIVNLLHKKIGSSKAPKKIYALIVCPTRELAVQIHQDFNEYAAFTNLRSAVVFGGSSMKAQVDALKNGVDLLIATPGRLLDLRKQGIVHLEDMEILVVDEADLMLKMGFIEDIKKILKMAVNLEQRLLFSATMPLPIKELADQFLQEPRVIEVAPTASTPKDIEQKLYLVSKSKKNELLLHLLNTSFQDASVLIFRKTKYGVDKTMELLSGKGYQAGDIHGDKSQSARQLTLNDFKNKEIDILVATDVAARGLDIKDLDVVINFDIPGQPEIYVHRIGRTGRAKKSGTSLSFCSPEETPYLAGIEKLIGEKIPVAADHPFQVSPEEAPEVHRSKGSKHKKGRKGAGSKAKKKRWY